jgi:Tfp pilus assembly protein PilV
MIRRAASETGFALMEVLISSVLLAIIVIGTLTAFDSSNRFTSNEQDRSQASTLAQQDEDRLRGLQVSQLASLNSTRTVVLNGTTFTIASTGQFQTDATSTSSCGAGGSADYIKTTSTVTWPAMGNTPPVVAESIITPPAGGSLIVQVVDSLGNGVSGMAVSGSGQGTLTGTTGVDGCSIFGGLAGGSYNVSVSEGGYVDKDGNTTPPVNQQAVTVIPGSSATKTYYFDQAGQIQAHFTSKQYGVTNSDVTGDTLVLLNNNMTYPGLRYFGTVGTPDTPPIVASNVFPFTSAYTVFGGSCAANQPSLFAGNTDPSVTVPQGGVVSFGGATPTQAAIPLPSLNVTVYSGTSVTSPGSVLANARVVITDIDASCTTQAKRTYTTTAQGRLSNPSLPFGNYTVCADASISTQRRYMSIGTTASPVANSNINGTAVNLYLQGTGSGVGSCP